MGGLGESLSDRMMTSSSSGDGGRFSRFMLLDNDSQIYISVFYKLSTNIVHREHKTGLYQLWQNY